MSEPKTIEVRTPNPAAGYGKAWVKTVTSVAEKAKTGHDWQGEFLRCNALTDARQGDLLVACGCRGSRKYSTKYATLYVAVEENYLCPVETVDSDEWAVELRDTANEYLALPWRERCQKALTARIEELEANPPQPSDKLVLWRKWAARGWQDGNHYLSPSGYITGPVRATTYDPATGTSLPRSQDEIDTEIAQATADCATRFAVLEEAFAEECKTHENRVRNNKKWLAELSAPAETASAIPVWAVQVSDEELLAEVQRRGLLALQHE